MRLLAALLPVLAMPLTAYADTVLYIPGMPVPQAAPVEAPSPAVDTAKSKNTGGRISAISVAGKQVEKQGPTDLVADPSPVYRGVVPPGNPRPANAETFDVKSGNALTWIGFHTEGTHTVFIQTTHTAQYRIVATGPRSVDIVLEKTKITVKNNARSIDMTYFVTPFDNAIAAKKGKDVVVSVEFKEKTPYEVVQKDNLIEVQAK